MHLKNETKIHIQGKTNQATNGMLYIYINGPDKRQQMATMIVKNLRYLTINALLRSLCDVMITVMST